MGIRSLICKQNSVGVCSLLIFTVICKSCHMPIIFNCTASGFIALRSNAQATARHCPSEVYPRDGYIHTDRNLDPRMHHIQLFEVAKACKEAKGTFCAVIGLDGL